MNLEGKILKLLRWIKSRISPDKNYLTYFDVNYSHTFPVTHASWTALLKKYVTDNGKVDYKSFLEEKDKLEEYLVYLSINPPNKNNWSVDDQLAFWINLYNAATVNLILNHYPIDSIRKIKTGFRIPFFNSVFDARYIKVGDHQLSLNEVEHAVLRLYNEPRIHFAINCASGSCPVLKNEAYEGVRLNEQLSDSTNRFLIDESKNFLNNARPKLSKIFNWYLEDFGGEQGLQKKLKEWTGEDIKVMNKNYMHYDWKLNEKEREDASKIEKKNSKK